VNTICPCVAPNETRKAPIDARGRRCVLPDRSSRSACAFFAASSASALLARGFGHFGRRGLQLQVRNRSDYARGRNR
jgi:hypothetical protein